MTNTMTVNEAQKKFKELSGLIKSHKADTFQIVEKEKQPVFVILSWEKYKELLDVFEGMMETEEILQDRKLMASLKKSEKQIKTGQGIPWKEAKKRLRL